MTLQKITEIEQECNRFLKRLNDYKNRMIDEEKINQERKDAGSNYTYYEGYFYKNGCPGTRESGALKRASLDLSRELVKLRRGK